jgi:hypothetical protein
VTNKEENHESKQPEAKALALSESFDRHLDGVDHLWQG